MFVERIDKNIWRLLLWLTRRPRLYLWRWWQYTFREPFIDPDQANVSLLANCGYKLEPSKPMKLMSCRPGFNLRRFRFGFYVSASPIHHKSRHWQMYWCRWIDDPIELYLVRCALRPRPPEVMPDMECSRPPSRHVANAHDSLLESIDDMYSYIND